MHTQRMHVRRMLLQNFLISLCVSRRRRTYVFSSMQKSKLATKSASILPVLSSILVVRR